MSKNFNDISFKLTKDQAYCQPFSDGLWSPGGGQSFECCFIILPSYLCHSSIFVFQYWKEKLFESH